MSKRHKALAAVIACVLLWGFSFISIKISIAVFPPMTLGAVRFAMAIVILFFVKKKLAPDEKIQKEDVPFLAGAGLTGVTLYFFFENNGVAMIPASEASIIIGVVPVITMIAEWVRERIISRRPESVPASRPAAEAVPSVPASLAVSGASLAPSLSPAPNTGRHSILSRYILPGIGALISLSGVALVAGISFTLSGNALGYVFMAGACVSWVCYSFLTRPLFGRRSRIYIVFWQSVIGFAGFLPFAFLEGAWQMSGFSVWAHVIFLGVFCSALSYWLYALAMRDLGVSTATLFINLIPVVSAVGGFFVLGERLRPLQWLGAGFAIAGVYLAMAASGKNDSRSNNE